MSVSQNTILFVDDDRASLKATVQALRRHGFEFETLLAGTPGEALELLRESSPEAIVLDLSLSSEAGPAGGLELLEAMSEIDPSVRALILTGHDSREHGIECLKRGAASFLSKPVDTDHLGVLLRDAVQTTVLRRSFMQLATTPELLRSVPGLSSRSAAMKPVLETIAYASANNQPVLIVGETGAGKGVLAQAIHQGSRRTGMFIRVQPRYGAHDLAASEIFGHERGAFTGALQMRKGLIEDANGGTLFLDEVDELPLETQILLLNALQEKTFRRLGSNRECRSNFRLVAATNRPLEVSLRSGKIREDFYHRIAHVVIELPPLRGRMEDIPDLALEHIRRLSNRENLSVQGLAPEAIEKLFRYAWPGNVRELFAVVENAAYRAQYEGRRFIEAADIILKKASSAEEAGSFRSQVRAYELRLIREALNRAGNNQSRAAELLRIDRSTLRRLLSRTDS